MRKLENTFVACLIRLLVFLTMFVLAFVVFFIVREALPLFSQVSLTDFLFGQKWMPIDITGTGKISFGIFNYIVATIYVSLLALVFAVIAGVGCAIFLSCIAPENVRRILYPVINMLAGIPSVIYGFMGIEVITPLFIKAGVHTGSCVLAAALLLSVMLLPYIVEAVSETLLKLKDRYYPAVRSLGIDKWYCIRTLILPAAARSILLSTILSIGRAMGETMAVMMVIGNANLFPHLLGKGESIASLIALEMGSAEGGSMHYHALYAAGLVLLVILLIINIVIGLIRHRLEEKEGL